MFNPRDHYWLAEDGRMFGSARANLVGDPDTDEAFAGWQVKGVAVTAWPRDAMDEQTSAALQEVLAPYGIFVDLAAYAADLRWRKEVGGLVVGGLPIATDDRSKIMIMGARVAAAANADWETVWHGADGGTYPLNAAQMIAISNAVEAHVNGTFATFATVKADIEAGRITTTGEIDGAFAGAI